MLRSERVPLPDLILARDKFRCRCMASHALDQQKGKEFLPVRGGTLNPSRTGRNFLHRRVHVVQVPLLDTQFQNDLDI